MMLEHDLQKLTPTLRPDLRDEILFAAGKAAGRSGPTWKLVALTLAVSHVAWVLAWPTPAPDVVLAPEPVSEITSPSADAVSPAVESEVAPRIVQAQPTNHPINTQLKMKKPLTPLSISALRDDELPPLITRDDRQPKFVPMLNAGIDIRFLHLN